MKLTALVHIGPGVSLQAQAVLSWWQHLHTLACCFVVVCTGCNKNHRTHCCGMRMLCLLLSVLAWLVKKYSN
jgi:hypothetical protein